MSEAAVSPKIDFIPQGFSEIHCNLYDIKVKCEEILNLEVMIGSMTFVS